MGDDATSERWRAEYLYSRAATIYGGTAEIQRNIIARRLLDLLQFKRYELNEPTGGGWG